MSNAPFVSGLSLCSVYFFIWDGDWLQWGRDALSLVHRPAIRPLHHVPRPHPTSLHPKRNRHPEIHEVHAAGLWSEWRTTITGFNSFSPRISVLGTLAATYLCVAVIVKYYLMESHSVIVTPEHSQGSVTLSSLSHMPQPFPRVY